MPDSDGIDDPHPYQPPPRQVVLRMRFDNTFDKPLNKELTRKRQCLRMSLE